MEKSRSEISLLRKLLNLKENHRRGISTYKIWCGATWSQVRMIYVTQNSLRTKVKITKMPQLLNK